MTVDVEMMTVRELALAVTKGEVEPSKLTDEQILDLDCIVELIEVSDELKKRAIDAEWRATGPHIL